MKEGDEKWLIFGISLTVITGFVAATFTSIAAMLKSTNDNLLAYGGCNTSGDISDFEDRLDDLEDRLDELEDLEELEDRLGDLESQLEDLKGNQD